MSLLEDFQKQLRYRLSLKTGRNQSEEQCLIKTFKYYDIQNRGEINFKQFCQAMEKLGLQVLSQQELRDVFDAYDTNGSDWLDFKELSALLMRPGQSQISSSSYMSDIPRSNISMSVSSQMNPYQAQSMMVQPKDLLKKFKLRIKSKGPKGIIGLQKIFKLIDLDGSLALSLSEFKKALKDFKMEDLQDQEVNMLFNIFDKNRDGSINYSEFLNAIRGEMNEFRRDLVERVFIILDRDNDGLIDISDMKAVYNARRHPDVMHGKKSEEATLNEFLDTFQQHHNLVGRRDKKVTLQEFMEYYANVGHSIDSDDYFSVIMNNAWNLSGNALTYQTLEKGWAGRADDDTQSAYGSQYQGQSRPLTASHLQSQAQYLSRGRYLGGKSSTDNPLAASQTNSYYQAQELQQNEQRDSLRSSQLEEQKRYQSSQYAPSMNSERSVSSSVFHSQKIQQAKFTSIVMERFRAKILARGLSALIGLRRQFKFMDSQSTGIINHMDFRKVIQDSGIDISDVDIKNAFKSFDPQSQGEIEYDEFVKVLIGPMSTYRASLAAKAFEKLDINQQGLLDLDYVISKFDAKRHPDARTGKRTIRELTVEFSETFTHHHQIINGYQAIDKISRMEFIEYYAHVSSFIESDQQFNLMVESVWNLDNKDNLGTLPFAGSKKKVLTVDPKQQYLHDQYKGIYGEGKAPFGMNGDQPKSLSNQANTSASIRSYNASKFF